MIRLEQVTKYYAHNIAVDNLSLEVKQGEVCVLIGPSGCGKTTTLRMINRLIEPSSGHIFVDGKDTSTVKPERLRQSIGYAIQGVGLFPHMTVASNIATVPELLHWEKGRIAHRIEELLVIVGLNPDEYAGKYPSQLSGGEAQRVGVARALAADPPILLMDEPFGAVDPLTRERLQLQFVNIQKALKKTIIFVTHDLDEAIRLADRIAIMERGELVQYDPPEVILSRPINKFVRDFVGTDRALKRLSRLSVRSIAKPAPSVRSDMSVSEATRAIGKGHSIWVTDKNSRLIGWVNRASLLPATSLSEAISSGEASEISIPGSATLREALSRMLGQGFQSLPITAEDGQLIGEVTLNDIEAATAETEPKNA